MSAKLTISLVVVLLLSACSITKQENGGKKDVDIRTPFASIRVQNEADARDTGMSVYAGARLLKKEGNDEHSANVNISSSMFGVKVVAVTFESDDPPEKLLAFYRKELQKWGKVVECHTDEHSGHVAIHSDHGKDAEVSCKEKPGGNTTELKVGTENRQHVVAVKPRGKGSEFSLVYVNARGKEETI